MVDSSLSGSRLSGLPDWLELSMGTPIELIEGLDIDTFKRLAPLLSSPDLDKFESTLQKMVRQLGLRRSLGKVVRVDSDRHQFAIQFDEIADEGRNYPKAQTHKPPMRASFSYKDKIGTFIVKGNLTPGAAIDLATDVVHDIRQCLVVVDLSGVAEVNRSALEKFCTRLRSELNEQDLAYALAVVCPFDWARNILGEIQSYTSLTEAVEALQSSLAPSAGAQPEEQAEKKPADDSANDSTVTANE